mgnify:CR=1 FL=1
MSRIGNKPIEIPEKIRRLKQKYIDELYSKYEGEETKIEST